MSKQLRTLHMFHNFIKYNKHDERGILNRPIFKLFQQIIFCFLSESTI